MNNKANIRTAAAQIDVIAGRPDLNIKKICQAIREAHHHGDDVLIFPEMAVPGYLLGDEWENQSFVADCLAYNQEIINAAEDMVVIWGNVDIDKTKRNQDGRFRKYNAAFAACNGEYLDNGIIHKTLLPNYREFDDARHFYPFRQQLQDENKTYQQGFLPVEVSIKGTTIKMGMILCEDMWSADYTLNPIDYLLDNGAEIIINLSSSPWTWRKNNKRNRVVRERLSHKPVPLIYCNNIGTQNNGKNIFLFDGNTTIYNPDGTLQKVAPSYQELIIRSKPFASDQHLLPDPDLSPEADTEELYQGLVYAIRRFFDKLSSKKVVIGISGGVDSTLSTLLLTEALGAENVYGINMPSRYNSNTTKDAAYQLAKGLGIHYAIIPIQQSYELTVGQLEQTSFERLGNGDKVPVVLSDLNKENIQARDRGSRVLAGVASALNAVFINNGNKTEVALGYATLYGDVNGALAPLADLYKWEIYHLVRHINHKSKVVPDSIFTIPASAELSDAHNVDEGLGDPIQYDYHDHLVRAFVEFRLDPENILEYYLHGNLAEKIKCDGSVISSLFPEPVNFMEDLEHKWRLYKINIFKRIQSPPIIAVSRRAFGFDLRESQNGIYFTRRYLQMKKEILQQL